MATNKPGDFFLGVIDFFGILLPGAVLLFLQGEYISTLIPNVSKLSDRGTAFWISFLIASYLLGHLLHGAGELLTILRNKYLKTYQKRDKNCAMFNKVSEAIKESKTFPEDPPKGHRNRTFHRALNFVRLKSPDAVAEIERQTASYKLFRSLTMVFLWDLFISLLVWG